MGTHLAPALMPCNTLHFGFWLYFWGMEGFLDFDWHLWSPEWLNNLPRPTTAAEDSATVWVSGLCCQDGPNLGHIQKFCRWPVIPGWHSVSSSPDLSFLLQDLWAKRRWNMASFCSKGPKGLEGKSIYLTDLARRALSWVAGLCPSSRLYRDRRDNLTDIVTEEWDDIFVNVQVTEELNA